MSGDGQVAPTADRAPWGLLAVLALPVLVLSMDVSVLLLALPSIAADLGASSTEQLWIADVYGFVLAGFLVTMGSVGDRVGQRRLLLAGALGFGVLSLLAAFATSPVLLVAARAGLGIAGATVMPATLALVALLFRVPRQRETAISLVFGCFLVGGALGPVVGGVLLELFWWGAAFLVAVPVMALLLVVGTVALPAPPPRSTATAVDLLSVALVLGAVLGTVAGVKLLARDGWTLGGAGLAVAGVLVGVAFVARQRRLAQPLLDVGLLRIPPVAVGMGLAVLGGLVLGGTFLVVTQHLQLVVGLDPLTAGGWMFVPTVAMAAGTVAGPRLARRLGPAATMGGGLALAGVGLVVLSRVGPASEPLWLVVVLSAALFGFGLPGGLAVNLVVGSVPPERAGAASGMSSTGQELGVALGLAVLGSAALHRYRTQLDALVPDGVPAAVLVRAEDSLAGALATGDPALVEAARTAFAGAVQLVLGIGAGVLLALALAVVLVRRSLPRTGQPGEREQPSAREGPAGPGVPREPTTRAADPSPIATSHPGEPTGRKHRP